MSGETNIDMEMPEANVFSSLCTSRSTLQHLTGRWGALVIAALKIEEESMRFGEIRRRIDGISDRMLSQTLTQLERDGMVERTVHSNIPPHVDYKLTDLGVKVAGPLLTLIETVESSLPTVVQAQEEYDTAGDQ